MVDFTDRALSSLGTQDGISGCKRRVKVASCAKSLCGPHISRSKIIETINKMADTDSQLHALFAPPPATSLSIDVLGELQSILRLHALGPQELSYKWESYTMKMGSESTRLDLETARAFKKDLQEILERESRGQVGRSVDRKSYSTPRAGRLNDNVLGMCVLDACADALRLILGKA